MSLKVKLYITIMALHIPAVLIDFFIEGYLMGKPPGLIAWGLIATLSIGMLIGLFCLLYLIWTDE